jgi:hypothetical protein
MTANFFVAAMTIQCAIAAVLYYFDQQYPLAMMYGGYTVANIGILWIALRSAT